MGGAPLLVESTNIAKLEIAFLHIGDADALPLLGSDAPPVSGATEIYHTTIATNASLNETKTTPLDLKVLGPLQPGLYLADIKNAASDKPVEIRKWFSVSNLGIEAFVGTDSITAQVRLLSELIPAVNVEVALVGANNREIGRTRADAQGFVHFPLNAGDRPAALYAYGADGEFTALNLAQAKPQLEPSLSAWILPDHARYQPGEIAKGLALVRNAEGKAVNGTLRFQLIDIATGHVAQEQPVKDQGAGSYGFALQIPTLPGKWRIKAFLNDQPQAIASLDLDQQAAPQPTAHDQAAVVIAPGRRSFPAGEPANISVQPPFAADVTLAVLDAQVREVISPVIGAEGAPAQIGIPGDEPAGVYVAATALAPGEPGQPIKRADGLAWLDVDKGSKRLGVQIEVPETGKAGGNLPVTITLSNSDGQAGHILIVGTPETAPVLPDPLAYFLGRRPLQVGRADSYGELVGSPTPAAPLDGAVGNPASPNTLLWAGPIATGADGKANLVLHLPDYSGQLRLNVIGWSEDRLGSAQGLVAVAPVATHQKPTLPSLAPAPLKKAFLLRQGASLPLPAKRRYVISAQPILSDTPAFGSNDSEVTALVQSTLEDQPPLARLQPALLLLDLRDAGQPIPAETLDHVFAGVRAVWLDKKGSTDQQALAHYLLLRDKREDSLAFAAWLAGKPTLKSGLGMAALAGSLQLAGDRAAANAAAQRALAKSGRTPLEQALTLLILADILPQLPDHQLEAIAGATIHPALQLDLALRLLQARVLQQATPFAVSLGGKTATPTGWLVLPADRDPADSPLRNAGTAPLYVWAYSPIR
jgi:hypothetical protein